MNEQKKIGARIQECRKQRHMTVEYLAELSNISPEFLRAIESGQKGMSVHTLTSLSIALQVSTDYLLFGSSEEDKYGLLVQTLQSCSEDTVRRIAYLVQQILELQN